MRIICRRHEPQCKRKTAASGYKGGNEHGGNCLYALGKISFASLAHPKLNNEGFSEQSIPSGDIVGSLCGSTNQRSTVTCEGDFPFPFQVPMIKYIWKEGTGTSMQEIEFYCRKCRKTMKMSYALTGDKTTPVLAGITIRCHTNKCTRVVMLKKYTEGQIIAQADAQGRCYL